MACCPILPQLAVFVQAVKLCDKTLHNHLAETKVEEEK
jgi:hypothetical protein